MESFATHFRRLRREAGRSQIELASRSGVSERTIGAIERGVEIRPHSSTIRALADGLGLSDDDRRTLERVAYRLRTSLPPRVRLLGREDDLHHLRALVESGHSNLTTVAGPPGCGKTSLVTEFAHAYSRESQDGVVYVSLEACEEDRLLVPTIARTMKVPVDVANPVEAVVSRLAQTPTLLVLDNFEHLLGAARIVGEIAARTPDLRVVVTSRSRLNLRAEQEYSLAALSPDAAQKLFVARARGATGQAAPQEREIIAEICERLDRLPLAIELVAPRLRVKTARDVLARLRELAGNANDTVDPAAHHRSLSDAIRWSYDRLDAREQKALRWLSVFPADVDVAFAEAVVDGGRDSIEKLLASNLVVLEAKDRMRLRMLHTIHAFASAELLSAGERDAAARRYAEECLHTCRAINEKNVAQAEKFDLLASESLNIGAAMKWLVDREEWNLAADLALEVAAYWYLRENSEDNRASIGAIADRSRELEPYRRTKLLLWAPGSVWDKSLERAMRYANEAVANARELPGEPELLAGALRARGIVLGASRAFAKALDDFYEAQRALEDSSDSITKGRLHNQIGVIYSASGKFDEAHREFALAIEYLRFTGHYASWFPVYNQAYAYTMQGKFAEAISQTDAAISFAEQNKSPMQLAVALGNRAEIEILCDNFVDARKQLIEAFGVLIAAQTSDGLARLVVAAAKFMRESRLDWAAMLAAYGRSILGVFNVDFGFRETLEAIDAEAVREFGQSPAAEYRRLGQGLTAERILEMLRA